MCISTCIALLDMFTSSRQNSRWTVLNWIHKWGGDFTGCTHNFPLVSFLTFRCFFLLRCRIPWFHYPIVYDIRSKPRKIISPTGSKGTRLCVLMLLHVHTFNMNTVPNLDMYMADCACLEIVTYQFLLSIDLQMVNIGLRVLARPQATMLPDMYRKLGLDFDERVLPSIMNEVCTDYVCTMHKEIFFSETTSITFNTVMFLLWLVCSTLGQIKIEIQLASGLENFSFQLPPLKYIVLLAPLGTQHWMPYWTWAKNSWISNQSKLSTHCFGHLAVLSFPIVFDSKWSLTRLLTVVHFAFHWTTN